MAIKGISIVNCQLEYPKYVDKVPIIWEKLVRLIMYRVYVTWDISYPKMLNVYMIKIGSQHDISMHFSVYIELYR